MRDFHKRFGLAALACAAILMLGAAPSLAQNGSMCSAFVRGPHGGWRVVGPVMLDLGGRLYGPTVGTIFPAGATQNGIEMSDVLDQQCGNR